MSKRTIALVKGDGSGPEMMKVACAITVEAAEKDGMLIFFEETPMGWNAYKHYGDTLPAESLERAIALGTIFFGGVGDPRFDNTIGVEKPDMKPEARALLTLRSRMGLLINARPMIYYKELSHLAQVRPETIPEGGVTQFWLRFLLGDSYFGTQDLLPEIPICPRMALGIKTKEYVTGEEDIVTDIAYYRRTTLEQYFRVAFAYAREKNLPLMSIDKANVMARYDFWRKTVSRIWKEEFSDVELIHQYVDSANALLFQPAKLNAVIVCGNEHGDILSDGAAAALGSMGMMCSSAINPFTGAAMFESGAGTAPRQAGKDTANPIGRILTAAMMLRHIGAPKGADAIEFAVWQVLRAGYRTLDLFQEGRDSRANLLGTSGMGEKILSYL